MEVQDLLCSAALKAGMNQYGFIEVLKIPFTADSRKLCEQNYCGRYGTNWQCPPGVGSWESLRDRILTFKYGFLFNNVYGLEDSYDVEGMGAAGKSHNDKAKIVLDAARPAVKELLYLAAGGCLICGACAYKENKPCRYPDKAFPSLSATGINVSVLAYNNGFKYINGANTVTNFGLLLYNL